MTEPKPRRHLTPEQLEKRKRLEEQQRRAKLFRGVPATPREMRQYQQKLRESEAERKHALAIKAKKVGLKKTEILAEDGSIQAVWADNSSFRRLGFQDHHAAAAERLNNDWTIARAGLKAQGYEPGVDGGSDGQGPHAARVAAINRLKACRVFIGTRNFEVAVAVVIYSARAKRIAEMAGVNHRAVKETMLVAMDRLDEFYHGSERKDRTWIAFSNFTASRDDPQEARAIAAGARNHRRQVHRNAQPVGDK